MADAGQTVFPATASVGMAGIAPVRHTADIVVMAASAVGTVQAHLLDKGMMASKLDGGVIGAGPYDASTRFCIKISSAWIL